MSKFDLNIKNYDYDELLHLFKVQSKDNRAEVLYKLNKKINDVTHSQVEDYIKEFYYKANIVVSIIHELLLNKTIGLKDVSGYLKKIHAIDETENMAAMTSMDVLNQIRNREMEMNRPSFNVNKVDYVLNDKNNTNPILNTAINEVSPGDLNSIKRITQLLNLNLNSCFRNQYYKNSPTDFLYNLPSEIKNVLSLRLVSIELPNSWYLFSSVKKNNVFYICVKDGQEYCISIPDGNYSYEALEHYLNATYFYESNVDYPLKHIKFSIHPHNLKSTFENMDPSKICFSIRFSTSSNDHLMNTCGWILGYRFATYNDVTVLVSEGLFDAGGDRYVYLSLNDFQYNNNTSNIVCFDNNILNEDVIAKIPMVNGKLSLIVNDNNNALSKIRRYNGPVNLAKLQIKLLDHFGNIIDLNNMDFSMTLELQLLYENFNFKNVTG